MILLKFSTLRHGDILTRYKLLAVLAVIFQALLFFCLNRFLSYSEMAVLSIIQLVFLVIIFIFSPVKQPLTILFLVANWIFHCGQLICILANYNEVLNLDFRWYVTSSTASDAFRFYFYAQTLISIGSIIFQKENYYKKQDIHIYHIIDANKGVALFLLILGLPFRLYLDMTKMMGAASLGYEGVYSLKIPAVFQAIAFFFDAAILLLLVLYGRTRKGTLLFWTICVYKIIAMSTGSRQEAFCFLVVWCLLYFGYVQKMSIARFATLGISCVILVCAVDAFGELRTDGFSVEGLQSYFEKTQPLDILWNSLGEFGCAFTTLAVTVAHVPLDLAFGMGRSYFAGILSVIPGLVSQFPDLKAATLFTTSIPNTTFFGGSMLGEFYYNLGWFGLAGAFLTGWILDICQNLLNKFGKNGYELYVWISTVVSVFLLLFIRGYFTDAVMKLVYMFGIAWIATGFIRKTKTHRIRNSIE